MRRAAQKTGATKGARTKVSVPRWPEPGSPLAEAIGATVPDPARLATEQLLGSVVQFQAASTRFGSRRLQRAMAAQAEMLGCTTLGELHEVQRRYADDMMIDYAKEWQRIIEDWLRLSSGHPIMPEADDGPNEDGPDTESVPV